MVLFPFWEPTCSSAMMWYILAQCFNLPRRNCVTSKLVNRSTALWISFAEPDCTILCYMQILYHFSIKSFQSDVHSKINVTYFIWAWEKPLPGGSHCLRSACLREPDIGVARPNPWIIGMAKGSHATPNSALLVSTMLCLLSGSFQSLLACFIHSFTYHFSTTKKSTKQSVPQNKWRQKISSLTQRRCILELQSTNHLNLSPSHGLKWNNWDLFHYLSLNSSSLLLEFENTNIFEFWGAFPLCCMLLWALWLFGWKGRI